MNNTIDISFEHEISERIENARRSRGMSLVALSKLSGVSRQAYERRIKGETEWRTKHLSAVARALRVRTEWLAGVES